MSREKPRILPLHELTTDHPLVDVFGLLSEKNRIATRDGKAFYRCRFRNHRRSIDSIVWSDSPLFMDCERAWNPGTIYKIRGHYTEHPKYGPNLEVLVIRPTNAQDQDDGFNEADFFERSRFDSDAMLQDLIALATVEVRDPPLRQLILEILSRHGDQLKQLPASAKAYYPFPGGWLEHVVNVTRTCCWLADQYAVRFPDLKPFNRDLILAGAILHDIGRLRELTINAENRTMEPSVEGLLIGHVILGRDLIRSVAREIPELNSELLDLLDHLILAHLNKPEWGSPRLPMIPEALILHNADDLDAKFEMYARHLKNDMKSGPVTESDAVLKKPLLKQRAV